MPEACTIITVSCKKKNVVRGFLQGVCVASLKLRRCLFVVSVLLSLTTWLMLTTGIKIFNICALYGKAKCWHALHIGRHITCNMSNLKILTFSFPAGCKSSNNGAQGWVAHKRASGRRTSRFKIFFSHTSRIARHQTTADCQTSEEAQTIPQVYFLYDFPNQTPMVCIQKYRGQKGHQSYHHSVGPVRGVLVEMT